jgi:uncharacterized protein
VDPLAYLTITVALACGAVVKGATGMGLPLVALPFLVAVLGLQHSIGILLIPILITNVWQLYSFRGSLHAPGTQFLLPFLGGGAVGVAAGTWLLVVAPERVLLVGLGGLLLGYVALRLWRPAWQVGEAAAKAAAVPTGAAAGLLQGATGISAPVGVTFIHAMRLGRDAHVFAVSAMFLLFAVVQLAALAGAGVMQPEWYLHGLYALVPVALFMPAGQWLGRKLSATAFDRMILIFLGLMGVKLLLGL